MPNQFGEQGRSPGLHCKAMEEIGMKGYQFEEFENNEINAIEVADLNAISLNRSGNSA